MTMKVAKLILQGARGFFREPYSWLSEDELLLVSTTIRIMWQRHETSSQRLIVTVSLINTRVISKWRDLPQCRLHEGQGRTSSALRRKWQQWHPQSSGSICVALTSDLRHQTHCNRAKKQKRITDDYLGNDSIEFWNWERWHERS